MIQPTNSNILVKLNHRGEIAGLMIPDKAKRWQENTIACEVIATGPLVREVEVGETVIVEGHAGKWLEPRLMPEPDETYRMIDQSDVLLVKVAA